MTGETNGGVRPRRRLVLRRRTRATLTIAALALAAFLAPFATPTAAFADDYPSWDDVIKARNSVSAQQDAIKRINGLLSQLDAQVQAAQAALDKAAAAYDAAESKYEAAQAAYAQQQTVTENLKAQRDSAAKAADDAQRQAAQWAAQVVKVTPTDPTLQFFVESDDAAKVLSAIGVTSRLSEQSNELYEQSLQQRNVADSLGQQAADAEAALKDLADRAASALDAAQAAAQAAQAASDAAAQALTAQQEHQDQLKAQLDVLQKNRDVTEQDYKAGQAALAAEKAKEALQNQGVDWTKISASGWVRPAGGFISARFGYTNGYAFGFHHGIDFANPCGSSIIAAHGGVVTYAGWNGELGYYMIVDNGNGIKTGYGHQLAGGFKVSVGQTVATGQRIGTVGKTGLATGCHLHFDVYANGTRIDPTPFLASVGIVV